MSGVGRGLEWTGTPKFTAYETLTIDPNTINCGYSYESQKIALIETQRRNIHNICGWQDPGDGSEDVLINVIFSKYKKIILVARMLLDF